MKIFTGILMTILLAIGLTACSNDREFTWHETGLYKGGDDPLLARDMHEELNNRFMKVQTDR